MNLPQPPRPGRWTIGAEEIQRLIDQGELAAVEANVIHADGLLARADTNLRAASQLVETAPEAAFTLLYDAARMAVTAVLARQGLRPTTRGGHVVVQDALRAQLGRVSHLSRRFGSLRRTRNDIEYPTPETPPMGAAEAKDALLAAEEILPEMQRLSIRVGPYHS